MNVHASWSVVSMVVGAVLALVPRFPGKLQNLGTVAFALGLAAFLEVFH